MSVRLFGDNFLDPDFVSSQTQSSEQAAFPASNLFNFQRRSKVWRSNGYWEITSSNNGIVFRETTAVDLTASVAAATYTSSSSLFTAIKTALEAAGASTYTITADTTTLKTKFASDGGGGGGIFEIDWTHASSTMASILGFNTTEEDTGALSYVADSLKIHTGEWITWDFGISTQPKAFFLIGDRNSPIKITPSSTIKLQANETNIWSSPTEDNTLTYDDTLISSVNTSGLWTNGALRYARLDFEDTDNAAGYVQIGSLYLGDLFTPTRGRVQYPFTGAYVDRSITSFSEGGQSFSDIREKTEVFTITWFGLTIADREEIDTLWDTLGKSNPFFIQFDSESAFSTDVEMTRYVKFQQEPTYDLVSPTNFACRMILREEL